MKKKQEFSKRILKVIAIVTGVICVFACLMTIVTEDMSTLNIMIPCLFTELATATGFYYNKAKMENQIKLKKLYGEDAVNNQEEVEQ